MQHCWCWISMYTWHSCYWTIEWATIGRENLVWSSQRLQEIRLWSAACFLRIGLYMSCSVSLWWCYDSQCHLSTTPLLWSIAVTWKWYLFIGLYSLCCDCKGNSAPRLCFFAVINCYRQAVVSVSLSMVTSKWLIYDSAFCKFWSVVTTSAKLFYGGWLVMIPFSGTF